MTTLHPPEPGTRLDPAFKRLAWALLTGILAVVFDTTIVNVALNTLGRDLHAGVSTIQWVTTGYLLALGLAVPITGWLVNRFGAKPVWMGALALFLAASIGASLATGAPMLIAFRVLQGLGGGLMLPVLQTLLVQAAAGRPLGRVTALIALPVLLGPVLGPIIGGLIVQHLSWRWIFWVNVPFGIAGLILAWRLMPAATRNRTVSLDVVGLALLSPGVALVLFGLSRREWLPSIAGAVLTLIFVIRAAHRSDALVDVRLFRVPSFSAATALMFLSGFALYGAMLLVPLYFQQVRGAGPLAAGLLLAPQGVGVLLSRGLAGHLSDRFGGRWVTFTGLAIVGLATLPFVFVHSTAGLIAALVVRGVGLGAVTIPVMSTAYEGLDREAIPHASIITRTAQQIGGSFGTTVLAVVLERTGSFAESFWWATGFTAAAMVIALWLPTKAPQSRAPQSELHKAPQSRAPQSRAPQ
jgi:EmrB/QacA subfamily drug resistance transporter